MALAQLTEVRPQDETKALNWLWLLGRPPGVCRRRGAWWGAPKPTRSHSVCTLNALAYNQGV